MRAPVLGCDVRDEAADVRRRERRANDASPQPVEVEQLGEEPLEPARLLREAVDHLRAQLFGKAGALAQRRREADDRGERRAQLVRDGGEDRVAQLVHALALRHVLRRAEHAR